MPAPFVFSYAHNDALDDFAGEFFDEVNKRVRFLTGSAQDGFKDDKSLRAGEVWSARIADELRCAPAIVCLYSPSYFHSVVCGRELQVMLERRLLYQRQQTGSVPGAIVPVFWQPTTIPLSLPDFQFEKPRSREFAGEGVWRVRDRRKTLPFKDVAQSVAIRVKEAAKTPLPDLGYTPVLGGVGSAFEGPPLPPGEFDANGEALGPQYATFVYPGAPVWSDWIYGPQNELLRIAASVAKGRELEPRQLMFDGSATDFPNRVASARNRKHLVVMLIDGTMLSDVGLTNRLREYDHETTRADAPGASGVLIAWPPGQAGSATALQMVRRAFPQLSLRQPPFFNGAIEQHDQFAAAVSQSLDALRMAVRSNPASAPTLAPTTPFTHLPSLDASQGEQAA